MKLRWRCNASSAAYTKGELKSEEPPGLLWSRQLIGNAYWVFKTFSDREFPKIPLTFLTVSPLGSNHNLQYEKWTETHKNKTKLLKRNTETARKTIETARKTMHRNGEKNHRNSQNKTTTSLRLYSQANKKCKVTMKQWNLLLTDWTCISIEFIWNSARSYMEWIDSWSALTDVVQNVFEGGGGVSA